MNRYKVQFTRTITHDPEYAYVDADSREQARDLFLGNNPTYFVIYVKELIK